MGEIAVRNCSVHGRYTYDMFNGTEADRHCPKCSIKKSKLGGVYMRNNIQNAVDHLGIEVVAKSLGGHAHLGNCDMHGMYAVVGDNGCPLCPNANGTTASEIEHVLDMKSLYDPTSGTNPGQVANPTGISERDIERGYEDSNGNRPGK